MNRPLTDRERCQQLEARVAELEEELDAWREGLHTPLADEGARIRAWRVTEKLKPFDPRVALCAAAMLVELLDRAGKPVSKSELVAASRHPGCYAHDEPDPKVAVVQIAFLRRALARGRRGNPIRAIFNVGYVIAPEDAASLATWLGLADG